MYQVDTWKQCCEVRKFDKTNELASVQERDIVYKRLHVLKEYLD